MKEKNNIFICAMVNYDVKVKTTGSAYCGTDFWGDSKFEDYQYEELRTISGFDLLKEFSKNLEQRDIFEFSVNNNTYYFSYFTPTNGSYWDKTYTILREI